MSNTHHRTDSPQEISYPTAADGRGSTRVNFKRRPHYMGPFESPQSYVMFGLWKQRLIETGEPPSTKELREIVDAFLAEREPEEQVASTAPKRRWPLITAVVTSTLMCIAIIAVAKIVSTANAPQVDEIALSGSEIDLIRGVRQHKATLAGVQRGEAWFRKVANLRDSLVKEGSEYGLEHTLGQNYR